MLFNLVKKDFMLIKKNLIFFIVFSVIAPIYVSSVIKPNDGGFLAFFITTLMLECVIFNSVSIIECKNKGSILLCATPYTRSALVKSKYLFILVNFLYLYVIYTITTFIFPLRMERLNIFTLGISLLLITIFFGINIPMQYKFGYEKTKFISMSFVFILPFIIPKIILLLQNKNINITAIFTLPEIIRNLLTYALIIVIGFSSMIISMGIYCKKDL